MLYNNDVTKTMLAKTLMPVKMYKMLCSSCVLSLLACVMNQARPSLFDFNQSFLLITTDSY